MGSDGFAKDYRIIRLALTGHGLRWLELQPVWLKRIRVILEPGVAGLHRADRFGTHFMYRVRIGRLETNFGGEMLRAEGEQPV